MAEIRTTKETYIETTGKKSYPVEVTRLRSDEPWEYEVAPGQWKLVDAVTIFDAGKEGTSLVYTLHRDYTPEQRAAGRRHIQEVLAKCMTDQGLW